MHAFRISRAAALVLLISGFAGGQLQAQVRYKLTDLGAGTAWAINSSGQIAGETTTGLHTTTAFLYSGGGKQYIDTLGGSDSSAYGINDAGQVVGRVKVVDSQMTVPLDHGFRYSNGVMQDITASIPSLVGRNSSFAASNNAGDMVGSWASSGASSHYPYSLTCIGGVTGGMPGTDAMCKADWVTDINNNGYAVGCYRDYDYASGPIHSVLFSTATRTWQELLGFGAGGVQANALNDNGDVAGKALVSGANHAFIVSGGNTLDLGTLVAGYQSCANGINGSDVVVGSAYSGSTERAFIYANGTMTDLNTLLDANYGFTLQSAQDINNSGQIVGYGLVSGSQHAFLLTPVPEPATMGMFVLAGAALLSRRRK